MSRRSEADQWRQAGPNSFTSRQPQQEHQHQQQNQQAATITRSVSNLTDVFGLGAASRQAAQLHGGSNWPQASENQLMEAADVYGRFNQLQGKQQQQQASQLARKRRSKSRDSGSILMEVNNYNDLSLNAPVQQEQRLYDNQPLGIYRMSQQHHHQQQQQQQQPQQQHQEQPTSQTHLVRSQTECSHLLGRLAASSNLHLGTPQNHNQLQQHVLSAGDFGRHHHLFQQIPHQPRSSDNSSSQLSADCHPESRRLVPTSIAHQHSATLDRRAINRHYHVYEHEFYPPRLVADQTMPPIQAAKSFGQLLNKSIASHNQRQAAIAIVPPLVRSDLDQQKQQQQQQQQPQQQQALAADASSTSAAARLSLNYDWRLNKQADQSQALEQRTANELAMSQGNARKSMPMAWTSNRVSCEPRNNFAPTCDYEQQQQQQQQVLHNSKSFEGQFGGQPQRHLFESTRQALLRDFDQMIGRELLANQDHSPSGALLGSSILTGVSLDMDTHGEHLIVSGTRVTMPPLMKQQQQQHQQQQPPPLPARPQMRPVSNVPGCGGSLRRARQATLPLDGTNQQRAPLGAAESRKPPQKPPRPSLRSQQIYKSIQLDQQAVDCSRSSPSPSDSSIIYDQPSVCSQPDVLQSGRQSSLSSMPSPRMVGPPVNASPMSIGAVGQPGQNPITQPPSEPPPPPPPQQQLAVPAPNRGANVIAAPNLSSPPSSCTSRANQQPGSQLLLATAGTISSTHCGPDIDSGFCTSNSPASHDSGSGTCGELAPLDEAAGWSRLPSSKTNSVISVASPPSPRTAQMSIEEALIPLEASSSLDGLADRVELVASPLEGPNALLLHERLKEMCQVSSDGDVDSDENSGSEALNAQVDTLFSWLSANPSDGHSNSSAAERQVNEYENCANLQTELSSPASSELGAAGESRQPPQSRKEVTLKVVVDQKGARDSNDQVFYIDPIELNKISGSEEHQQQAETRETHTLTDEELCANVDKDSGYIRFTLRRRRGSGDRAGRKGESGILGGDQSAGVSLELSPGEQNYAADDRGRPPACISNGSPAASDERKHSLDSAQLDLSQASSSSSASSGTSIKSIVPLRALAAAPQQATGVAAGGEAPDEPDERVVAAGKPETRALDRHPQRQELPDALAKVDCQRPKCATPLLVSEVVRRVDAGALKQQQQQQPVAAARGLARRPESVRQEPRPAPVRRSICWPPPSANEVKADERADSSARRAGELGGVPAIGRVTANRLSFQRLIEENTRNSNQTATLNRPKPAPPAKPAGLVTAAAAANTKYSEANNR